MDTVPIHSHDFPAQEWPFADPVNVVAISTVRVFREGFPILLVSHDADGDWQVLCNTTAEPSDGMVVCLGCAYQRDKTIGELANLPRGWMAWRDSVMDCWHREPSASDEGS